MMKTSGSFTLLLLLGFVSANETSESKPPSPPDLYAALRDLTASLVQLKADVATERDQLRAEVDQLKAQVDKQKTELEKLNQQQQVQQVAFSASLLAESRGSTLGPLPTAMTLIFKNVQTNIGNAYSSTTGLFTAPVKGAYHFDWTTGAYGDHSHGSGAWLLKNSQKVFMAFEDQKDGFMTTSKGVTLLLEAGDVVSVLLLASGLAFDDYNHHTTFSGHLVFPM
ncbi:complement C1q-like protein 4 isoform X1 [Etheostoma spectabile]|uniref:complement C1q-like protein 4 isoform X1 n=1 Tax=Etheostoma spectabile TaxID=54343 RepID=UPI0013AEEDF9|nr:complement C1q-like protein 4 isoform X1 [Etheostoma spectabile]